jgi:N-acyl-L-homoserine lactone synthetase
MPQFWINFIPFQEKMSSQKIRRELREKRKQLFVEKRRYELEMNDLFDEIDGLLGR